MLTQGEGRDESGFERVEADNLRETMTWTQGDTERGYSQTEWGKNALAEGMRTHVASGAADSRGYGRK
jgi:hypothetical protein